MITKIYSVLTGDGKMVGLFRAKVNAQFFIKSEGHRYTSELFISEIYSDIDIQLKL